MKDLAICYSPTGRFQAEPLTELSLPVLLFAKYLHLWVWPKVDLITGEADASRAHWYQRLIGYCKRHRIEVIGKIIPQSFVDFGCYGVQTWIRELDDIHYWVIGNEPQIELDIPVEEIIDNYAKLWEFLPQGKWYNSPAVEPIGVSRMGYLEPEDFLRKFVARVPVHGCAVNAYPTRTDTPPTESNYVVPYQRLCEEFPNVIPSEQGVNSDWTPMHISWLKMLIRLNEHLPWPYFSYFQLRGAKYGLINKQGQWNQRRISVLEFREEKM